MKTTALIVGVLAVFVGSAQPTELYPSVQQLQQALNAYPGAKLPPQVMANGRVWTGYYVGAKAIGAGRYSIIIELK